MKVNLVIAVLLLETVWGNNVRKLRQIDEEVNSRDDGLDYPTSHCIQDVAKSFTCSDGSFDEILTEVTTQANILKIGHVFIQNIPDSAFQKFTNLVELEIKESNVSSLGSRAFQGLAHLEILDLSNNLLNNLSRPYFSLVGELVTLNLNTNKILSVSKIAFNGLTGLHDLDLSKNLIENIPSGVFSSTPSIITINLSNNRLSSLPRGLFGSLQSLQIVNLAYNRISEIQDDCFSSVPVLKTLHLQGNELQNLETGIFDAPVQQLEHISIESNVFKQLDAEALLRQTPSLKTFSIAPNPWNCDCLNYMLEIIEGKDIEYTPRQYFEGTLPVCKISNSNEISNDSNPCKSHTPKPSPSTITSRPTLPSSTNPPRPVYTTSRPTRYTTTTAASVLGVNLKFPIPFW